MKDHRQRLWIAAGLLLWLASCASKYNIKSYPSGAKISAQNIVSKEKFEIGEAPLRFEHEERFGEGFILLAEKQNFSEWCSFLFKKLSANQKRQKTFWA